MRLLFVILITILNHLSSYSQGAQNKTQESTSKVLKRISSHWIKDSLANNGFRRKSYKEVLNSKVDSVTTNLIVKRFGKPNQVKNTNHGLEYWYYVYDTTKLPKDQKGFEIAYLTFLFDPKTSLLKEIDENAMP